MAAPTKVTVLINILIFCLISGCSHTQDTEEKIENKISEDNSNKIDQNLNIAETSENTETPETIEPTITATEEDIYFDNNDEEEKTENIDTSVTAEEAMRLINNEPNDPKRDRSSENKLPWDASLSYDANGRLVIQHLGNSTTHTNITSKTLKKFTCKGKNLTEVNVTAEVQIVNSTELIKKLSNRSSNESNCLVVMFYAPFCMFSAQAAPHYNALGRLYPQLDILAIDAFKHSGLNAKFGTVAVPNILIFHNSKAVARFNGTERTIPYLVSFVHNVTGIAPNQTMEVYNVTEQDYSGPLSSVPEPHVDYLLIISWIFTILVAVIMFARSQVGLRVWRTLASLGQDHQHVE